MSMESIGTLPPSSSPDLGIDIPTPDECVTIWKATAASWSDSLTLPLYLKESKFLSTVPLAKDGGATTWILVDRNLAPNHRPILTSCESFRKRSLTSDANGTVEENIVHGIASVFCPPPYRRRGYAARHMAELARVLRGWQAEHGPCIGTVLYSDIGKAYYARLGWRPNASNSHLLFSPVASELPVSVQLVREEDLADLCRRDEAIVRAAMAAPSPGISRRMTILPDLDHMLWHIRKEDFATEHIFGKTPTAKGSMSGSRGKQVWAIWTHRYYQHPEQRAGGNVLYILRLVVEGDPTANKARASAGELPDLAEYREQSISLRSVLQAAQAQAAKWQLDEINLWEPSPLVQQMLSESDIEFTEEERHEQSIASGFWYDRDGKPTETPVWINNEHYAWL